MSNKKKNLFINFIFNFMIVLIMVISTIYMANEIVKKVKTKEDYNVKDEKFFAKIIEKDKMVLDVKTSKTNSTTYLGFSVSKNEKIQIDWGDGIIEVFDDTSKSQEHIYKPEGNYIVKIAGKVKFMFEPKIPDGKTNTITGISNWGNLELEYINNPFGMCEHFVKIAGPNENSFKYLKSAKSLFIQKKEIEQIPEDFFNNAPELDEVENIFYGCTKLKKINENIFLNNPKIRNFKRAFSGCISLKINVPKLWEKFKDVEKEECFKNVPALNQKEIPDEWKK